MIQFGTGKVDFAGVFGVLKAAGFDGPIMVECCKVGATAEETMANARANREFLEGGSGEGVVRTTSPLQVDDGVGCQPRHRELVAPSATTWSVERQPARTRDMRLAGRVRAAHANPQTFDFAAAVVEEMQPRLRRRRR